MKKDLNSIILTKNELEIMEVMWARKKATVRDVFNLISRKRTLAYSTISSEMKRLEKKQALVCAEKGRAFVYIPMLSRQQAIENHLKYLIENVFGGDTDRLVEFVLKNMFEWKDLLSVMYSKGWRHSMMVN